MFTYTNENLTNFTWTMIAKDYCFTTLCSNCKDLPNCEPMKSNCEKFKLLKLHIKKLSKEEIAQKCNFLKASQQTTPIQI